MIQFAPGCFCSLLFWGVSLGGPFANSQKVRDLGVLAKFAIARLYGHFSSRTLQQNVVLWLHFKCILIRRWCDFRQGVFVAYIFEEFPLAATLKNLRKCATEVSLPNWPKLGFTGTFGAEVCSKMLCYNCTSRAYWLEDDAICARFFL